MRLIIDSIMCLKGELDKLCNLPNVIVEKSFYEKGNWCIILHKPRFQQNM